MEEDKGEMTLREAARIGGRTTLERHGKEHFVKAGIKSQAIYQSRYTSEDRRRFGKMGGRPRRKRYDATGEKEE